MADKEFEYDQFVHGALESEEETTTDFNLQMDKPLKTFCFLRDIYINGKYNLRPARSGISADGDPFLAYKPRNPKKTNVEELYIETYEGSIGVVVLFRKKFSVMEYFSIEELCKQSSVKEYFSIEELCKQIDEIIENELL